jgi:putative methanogenesis marker protein 1
MFLNPCKKHYILDTQRTVPPEETLARIEKKMATAGITRVADITNLDRIGIPVFSSIRPTAEMGSISVYNGKGATPAEAKVSAMMEGIERFSAESAGRDMIMATYGEILHEHKAVNPADLILPPQADASAPLVWVAGHEINRDEEIYLPAHAVFHPMPRLYPPLFRTNTNGLASGNTREEAVFHALMEVIERDAWSLAEASRRTGSRICDIGDGLAADLLKKFTDAHVEVQLKNITSDIGIPTFAAVSDDTQLKDPTLLTIGMGTHTSARITLLRALTEVAQSRLTQIHGAREDTTVADFRRKMGYERTRRINKYWFDAPDEVAFSSIPSFDSDDFLTDIRYVSDALERSGMDRVIVVDLTRQEIGVPVVRVVVPGLEVYAMDQERSGERCRNARNNRIPRSKP